MSALEYIPSNENQRERRLSLEQELHHVETCSTADALPEGFNVEEFSYEKNLKGRGPNSLKNILMMILCCGA